MNKITVDGMHCDACTSLIKMELDDAQLSSAVNEIKVLEDNKGEIIFNDDVSQEDQNKISEMINKMDNYKVV